MDGVISDFEKERKNNPLSSVTPFIGRPDKIPNIYKDLEPIEGSIESVTKILKLFLSTPPWDNPDAWTHKRRWIHKYFGKSARHKLILSARKDLNIGDYLIDDSKFRGQPKFNGEWIEFGRIDYPNWKTVLDYLGIN